MKIGSKIYFEKNTGNVLLNTGEMCGSVRETTIVEDFENYIQLKDRIMESIGCIQLEYGQYKNEFTTCTGYNINIETNEIIFDFTPIETTPTIEDINRQIRVKIALKYDTSQEIEMLRLGMEDSNNAEYLAYKTYIAECITWGENEKTKYGLV